MRVDTPLRNEVQRREAPGWASSCWDDNRAAVEVRPFGAGAEPFELVTFYVDDELPSVDEVWTARLGYTVVAALGIYIAAVVIAAWLDGRL